MAETLRMLGVYADFAEHVWPCRSSRGEKPETSASPAR